MDERHCYAWSGMGNWMLVRVIHCLGLVTHILILTYSYSLIHTHLFILTYSFSLIHTHLFILTYSHPHTFIYFLGTNSCSSRTHTYICTKLTCLFRFIYYGIYTKTQASMLTGSGQKVRGGWWCVNLF